MIKSNELRIGNIVNHIYDTIQIESIFGDSVNVSAADMGGGPYIEGIDCKDIEPMPLTEEWLAKFGFVKDEQHECFVLWRAECEVEVSYFDDAVNIVGYSAADTLEHIKFVHQFQNLYFALTGEELTIKEAV